MRLLLLNLKHSLPWRTKYVDTGELKKKNIVKAWLTQRQWYDLNEKDRRPKPTPILHPWLREDRFFDSLGPGGVRTPRPESVKDHPTHAEGGQDLEIDKSHIHQYAHYGYVYCMVLAKGLRDDLKEEILISGGGDGAIKLWTVGGEDGAISELHKLDDGRDEGDSVLSLVLDGPFLYAGRMNGEVNVWDLETRQLVRNLRTKTEDVLALSFGGGYLFCAGVSGTVDVSWRDGFVISMRAQY